MLTLLARGPHLAEQWGICTKRSNSLVIPGRALSTYRLQHTAHIESLPEEDPWPPLQPWGRGLPVGAQDPEKDLGIRAPGPWLSPPLGQVCRPLPG